MLLQTQVENVLPLLQPGKILLCFPAVRHFTTTSRNLPQEKTELLESLAEGAGPEEQDRVYIYSIFYKVVFIILYLLDVSSF